MAGHTTVWYPERRAEIVAALRASTKRDEAAKRMGISTASMTHGCMVLGVAVMDHLDADRDAARPPTPETRPNPTPSEPLGTMVPEPDEGLLARVLDLESRLPTTEEGSAVPGKDQTAALLFDLHYMEHDPRAWDAFLKWARAVQPDEVIVSEFAEWLSASQHGNGAWGTFWKQEVAAVRRGLIQLRSVVPNARIVMQEANHDTRLTRILENHLPAFAGALTVPNELRLRDLGIEWVGERVVLRRGPFKIIHGHQLESGMRGCLPKYHTAKAVQVYGERGCTVVYGHTHKIQSYVEPCEGGEKRAVNIGCMRTLVPDWHKARESGWVQQFAVARVSASGAGALTPVDVTGGTFFADGKWWGAT
jgi:hypothetical protein